MLHLPPERKFPVKGAFAVRKVGVLRCIPSGRLAAALICVLAFSAAPALAQSSPPAPPPEFARLAAQLTDARDNGGPESEPLEQQALQLLDRAALDQLNAAKPDLDALNTRLAAFVTHRPPVGEGYRVVRLGGDTPSYALLADFGLGGPSAVRIYAGAPGHLALAARVDRYAQKDFFDDYIEIVPIAAPDALFVTVAGRTDELQTGVFTAWYFDGHTVAEVGASDILQQSSYEAAPDGFRLTYCAKVDPVNPEVCRAMQRDRYVWQDRMWKNVESTPLPAAPPPR